MWPLCELPDFCLLRDDGPNPSRQSACFPHELCGAGDCLDVWIGSLPSILPSLDVSRHHDDLKLLIGGDPWPDAPEILINVYNLLDVLYPMKRTL